MSAQITPRNVDDLIALLLIQSLEFIELKARVPGNRREVQYAPSHATFPQMQFNP